VSDNPAIRDFLRHEETCLVVPPGDAAAFRAALARLLAEPDTCARLGAAARRLVEERIGADAYAARCATLVRRLVGRG
jgi:glycosyltransferase involved in cell wall biosynthesis